MTPAARRRSEVRMPALCISAAAWILLLAAPGGVNLHPSHSAAMPGTAPSPAWLGSMLGHIQPASLAMGWALMLVAMMSPVLIAPVRHIRDRSFAYRRWRAIALFVAGYAAIWMAAG